MQLFKTFYKVIWDNKITLTIYIVLYSLLLFIQTFSGKSTLDENFSAKSLNLIVIDEDNSTLSKGVYDYLDSIHNIYKDFQTDKEYLLDSLYYRTTNYILTIPEGFEKSFMNGDTTNVIKHSAVKGSGAESFVTLQIDEYLKLIEANLALNMTAEEAVAQAEKSISELPSPEVLSFSGNNEGEALRNVAIFNQYLPYVFALILMCGMTPVLSVFKKKDLAARIECSSQNRTKRLLTLSAACVSFAVLTWVLFQALIYIACGSAMFSERAVYCFLNSLCEVLFSTALALFLSSFSVTDSTLNLIANIFGLSSSFLCGIFVPQSLLSDSVLAVGKFLPQYWYVKNNNMIGNLSTELFDTASYWKYIGIQMLFVVFMFALSLAVSKLKKQKR